MIKEDSSIRPLFFWMWLSIAVVALLHLITPFLSGMSLWSTNTARFLPVWSWGLVALPLLTLLPPIGRAVSRVMIWEGELLDRSLVFLVAGGLAAAVFALLLPDRLFFLGDFFLRQSSAEISAPPDLLYPQFFPLDLWLHYSVPNWAFHSLGWDPNWTNRLVGAMEMALLVFVGAGFARALGLRGAAGLTVLGIIWWGGWLTLYTGLAKGFSELVIAAVAVGALGLLVIREGRGQIALAAVFSLGLLFHRAALALLPAVYLAMFLSRTAEGEKRSKQNWVMETIAWLMPVVVILILSPKLLAIAQGLDLANFGFGVAREAAARGNMLDSLRLLDLANVILLLVPLAPLGIVLLLSRSTRGLLNRAQWIFFGGLLLPFAGMFFLYRPPQGAFRDFDGLAACGVVVALVVATLLGSRLRARPAEVWLATPALLMTAVSTILFLSLFTRVDSGLSWVEALAEGPPARSATVRVHTWDFVGARLYREGDTAGSARVLARAAELAPSPRLLAGWAKSAKETGDWVEAERAYRLLLERAPEDQPTFRLIAHLGIASASGRKGDLATARTHLEQALAIDPQNSDAIRLMQQVEAGERALK